MSSLVRDDLYWFTVASDAENFCVAMTVVDKNIITGQHGTEHWNEDSLEFNLNLSGGLGATAYHKDMYQIKVKPGDIGKSDLAALNATGTGSKDAGAKDIAFKTDDG